MTNRIFILLFFILTISRLNSQVVRFEHITVQQGLSQSTVKDIIQDKYGFMWFGTADGLNRYDGYSFTVFKPNPLKKGSIEETIIRCLHTDRKGNVWIGGEDLSLYDFTTETFHKFHNDSFFRNSKFKGDLSVSKIFSDQNSNIYCCYTNGEILMLDNKTKTFRDFRTQIQNANELSWFNTSILLIDKDNNCWLRTRNKYGKDLKDVSWTIYCSNLNNLTGKNKIRFKKVVFENEKTFANGIIEDNNDILWAFTNDGIYFFDRAREQFIPYKACNELLADKAIGTFFVDNNNNFWFRSGNNKDLSYFISAQKRLMHFPVDEFQGILNSGVNKFCLDQSGVLWIGTYAGIEKINLENKKFAYIGCIPNNPNSLTSKNAISITQDSKENLWIGSNNDFTIINKDFTKFNRFNETSLNCAHFGSSKHRMVEVKPGVMVQAGVGLTIVDFEKRISSYIHPTYDSVSLLAWVVWDLHIGKKTGNLYVGTADGFNVLPNPEQLYSDNCKQLFPKFKQYSNDKLIGNNVWGSTEDSKGQVWVSTSNGITIIGADGTPKESFKHSYTDSTGLTAKIIRTVYEDSKGRIWIGTEGGGLCKFIPEKKTFEAIRMLDGLASDVICGILEDNNGNLWISTTKGISKFNPDTRKIKTYDFSDGLQSNEFNRSAYCKLKDGRFAFGGVNGLNIFHPDSIHDNPYKPNVLISKLFLYNKPVEIGVEYNGDLVLQKSLLESEEITLSYRNKVFSIEFVGLHYANPQKNQYKYKMEGFDEDWIQTGADRRIAHYTNLPAGKYTFKVCASNCDGLWNEVGESMIFVTILPPFWETWWFRTIMIILIIFIIGAAFYYRMYQIQQQKIKLQKQVDEQTKEIREQSNVLQEINVLLEERQEEIMAQKEEITLQADELKKLNSTKDRFFSIIGHDLKNPFHAINGLAAILKENNVDMDPNQKLEIINMIEESSKGATALLENLLLWSRSQSNRIEYSPEVFNLYEIAHTTIILLKVSAEKKQLKIINQIPSQFNVYGDVNMITTVIRNLINNAVKFTQASGEIKLSVKEHSTLAYVSISDTGVGMDEETSKKLFDLGTNKSTKGTSGEAGTGLGLVICKEFIEKNGGKIWVESQPGKGSNFIFTLSRGVS